MMSETIAAISTALGEGAIGIVRLSGSEAFAIADKIIKLPKDKKIKNIDSHTINYGHVINPENKEKIEEIMLVKMATPKTYTCEDIIEINCHGGIVTIQKILQLCLDNGARLAEPGEFTKRAFLNGRIDLSQAEAVIDFIKSKTTEASLLANNQIQGRLSSLIKKLRAEILDIIAVVEVNIDYPEYDDLEIETTKTILEKSVSIKESLENLLETSKQGKIIKEGLNTAIIGRPNVGKSSLLNNLLQENKAIVTDIAGTTRDVLEEYVNIKGVPIKLIDTAGIRDTEDVVEKIGVERSREVLKQADLVLFLINSNEKLTDKDKELLKLTEDKQTIIILNKLDLETKIDITEVESLGYNHPIIKTSMTTYQGIEDLEKSIRNLFFEGKTKPKDATYLSNTRQVNLITRALESLNEAINAAQAGLEVDMVLIDYTKTFNLLGEVIGENTSEELINELFSRFCLGK
ncbi:tRNA uridine-5-carboxymethylaminomethyl(34) synthesis GTPase MnmE [Gemella sp. zg-570]|nr:tRNA uridine-5-carboxymethylaminomethyl(34) synthesis GTPase MnmE [Gemella sp. zg-570]QWQ39573.1 tRNA uridine-5-carboxymethylaminomethyl(34) synthesis GTPase MnmE [Gemella sp. zg-570]